MVLTSKRSQWLVLASNLSKINIPPQFCSVSLISSSYWKAVWCCLPYSNVSTYRKVKNAVSGAPMGRSHMPATDSIKIAGAIRIRPSGCLVRDTMCPIHMLKHYLQRIYILFFFLFTAYHQFSWSLLCSLLGFITGPGNFINSDFPLYLQLGLNLPGPVEHKESL